MNDLIKKIKILKRLVRINENKLKVFFVFPSPSNKAESYRIDQILALKKENHEIICLSIKNLILKILINRIVTYLMRLFI